MMETIRRVGNVNGHCLKKPSKRRDALQDREKVRREENEIRELGAHNVAMWLHVHGETLWPKVEKELKWTSGFLWGKLNVEVRGIWCKSCTSELISVNQTHWSGWEISTSCHFNPKWSETNMPYECISIIFYGMAS